jgi:hypothetical protein
MNKQNGFFEIKDVIDIKIINDFFEEISQNYDLNIKKNIGGTLSGHLNCIPGSSAKNLLKNINQKSIFDEISNFFKINIYEYNMSIGANINLPGSHYQHMHTDSDFYDEFYILNIPLVDTNEVNGSLSIIPGSHREPYSYIDYKLKGLYKKRIRVNQSIGSCIVRSSNLWHRGTPNKSLNIRPMINVVFTRNKNSKKDFLVSNLESHPDLNGNIEFINNWYKSNFLGYLWEFATVKIPFVHALKRVVMSLYRPKGTST